MTYTAATPVVVQVAAVYDLRPDLLAAQIHVESSGDRFAFRHERAYFDRYIRDRPTTLGYTYGPLSACSYGLLQVLFETALEMGFDDHPWRLFDERVGLTWGAKYLQRCLLLTQQDYRRALVKYNGAGTQAEAYAARVFALADQQKKDTNV